MKNQPCNYEEPQCRKDGLYKIWKKGEPRPFDWCLEHLIAFVEAEKTQEERMNITT